MTTKTKDKNAMQSIMDQMKEIEAQKLVLMQELKSAFTPDEILENVTRFSAELEQVNASIALCMNDIKVAKQSIKELKKQKKIVEQKNREMVSLAGIKKQASKRTSSKAQCDDLGNLRLMVQDLDIDFSCNVINNGKWYDEVKEVLLAKGIEGASSQGKKFLYACTNAVKGAFNGVKFPNA